ncbi:hypothetical protein PZ897_05060 [Hoeflea sp. YIM 152468]|uniref:hypothetical protein n=1 Tax=Hoeflea sp. YIM 152468 TaxID=3031759 RepID=UPI0023DB05B2|nr:hypothetical protein [Hoeflea sp. YIM 152468]MDF1607538.1 hypothetical protein [Hoeflea sp. YIM 152468]
MTHDSKGLTEFDNLMQKAISDGKDGRAEIVRRLAMLPLDKLASVPPSALAMIGPEGLAALAAQRSEFAGLAPKPYPIASKAAATPPFDAVAKPELVKGRRLSPTVLISTAVILAALSFDRVVAMTGLSPAGGSISRNAMEWPRCLRLDRYSDGCVYRTGSSRLSLVGAAGLLHMDVHDLADLNRHLAGSAITPLPASSLIVILRDRSRLSGRSS